MVAAPGQADLLAWPELHDAEMRVQAADAAWGDAERLARHPPQGRRNARLQALRDAAQAALKAGVELERLRQQLAP